MNNLIKRLRLRLMLLYFGGGIAFFSITMMPAMDANASDLNRLRFTKLPAFNPHRLDFQCKYEASVNPPITPEADALFQRALALGSHDLWPEQRDYVKMAALYEQAMKLGHWKAQFNLAGLYLKGLGVPQDVERAIELTEDLMAKGVPAAWDNMGTYYMGGLGDLKRDATVAYAFWQRAADMGSMAAQTYIGAKLRGDHDEPPEFWGNYRVGRKMLECAYAQGASHAAFELGKLDQVIENNYRRARREFQDGVKFGSQESATALLVAFDGGSPLVENLKDPGRAQRYMVLSDALYTNPDLRFPNLDKVLPLPPAELPMWDGNKQTLIDAAKAIVAKPAAPSVPAAKPSTVKTGRAYIPEGSMLPERPQVQVPAQYETTSAPESGYWIARLMRPVTDRQLAWNAEQLPMRYEQGELFDRSRPGLVPEDGRILFHFLGRPVPRPAPVVEAAKHPAVAMGVARYAEFPEPTRRCRGNLPCPATGIWAGRLPDDHPKAVVFNHWGRQAYVAKDAAFPDPRDRHLDIEPRDVRWRFLGNANEERPSGFTQISLQPFSLEKPAGKPEDDAGPAPA